MNGDNFKEWFRSILSRIGLNFIVVMNNTHYYCVKFKIILIFTSKKLKTSKWFSLRSITFNVEVFLIADRGMRIKTEVDFLHY